MRIKMKTTMAGPDGCASPGQVIDRPEEEARALVAGGYAEAVEHAVLAPHERAEAVAQKITPPPERVVRGRKK